LAYALFVEPRRLVLHEETLHLSRWNPAHRGLKVALVSDLHVGSPFWGPSHMRELVQQVNGLRPDLILLAGDYMIDHVPLGTKVAPETIADVLAPLSAPLGVFAVLGNHDCWNDPARVRGALVRRGLRVLEDEAVTLSFHGQPLTLVGLADQMTHVDRAAEVLADLPSRDDASVLVLVHEPDVFAHMDARVSLVLAGHTHGGQVKLPWLGRPRVSIATRFGERYAAGAVVEGARHLFVTTGVGTSVFPIRLGVPPEIVLLTLE
jgi:predicted MPP superfamily phosphohydrolase